MSGSEPDALPLGYGAINETIISWKYLDVNLMYKRKFKNNFPFI